MIPKICRKAPLCCWMIMILLSDFAAPPHLSGFAQKPAKKSRVRRKTPKSERPPELIGSKEQRIKQNIRANNFGLQEIITDADLERMFQNGLLEELADNAFYVVDSRPEKRCFVTGKNKYRVTYLARRILIRPAVKKYLDRLAEDYSAEFGNKLKITSGARSVQKQNMMNIRGSPCRNPYAAIALDPLERSLHPRGIVVDISRRVISARGREITMSRREISWMRARLIRDKKAGMIDAEEDEQEESEVSIEPIEEKICYHIAVFPKK